MKLLQAAHAMAAQDWQAHAAIAHVEDGNTVSGLARQC